jgi:hypothetical protein
LRDGNQKEWEEREAKARGKFDQRYNKPTPAQSASPGAQDAERAAQEELRQRLAVETKRMEDAEVRCPPVSSAFIIALQGTPPSGPLTIRQGGGGQFPRSSAFLGLERTRFLHIGKAAAL